MVFWRIRRPLLMARIEASRFDLCLPSKPLSVDDFAGMLIGICEISFLIVGCMAAFSSYRSEHCLSQRAKSCNGAHFGLQPRSLIALPEEFLFRDTCTYTGRTASDFGRCFILSPQFSSRHLTNSGENWFGVAIYFYTGLLVGVTCANWLRCAGRRWHAAFDFGESFLFSGSRQRWNFEGHLSNATIVRGARG